VSSLGDLLADLTSGNDDRAEAAASALAQTGESAIPALEPLLESSDVDQRWWAVRTLAQMDHPRQKWFVRALNDDSAEVRQAAALALAAHPVEEAAPALVKALSDEESMVVSLAVNALTAVGQSALPSLLNAFENASSNARVHIMRALAEIGGHRAIPLMLKAADDDSALLSYWAKEGLERMGLNMVYIKPQ